jgi:hypothetical protein
MAFNVKVQNSDPTKPAYAGEGGGHWYDREGRPQYTVIAKGTGLPRAATLADARKNGWVPGVTSITKGEAAPALTEWLINQAVMAALTLPAIEGESLEDRKKRITTDAGQQANQARDRGQEIHNALEQAFLTGKVEQDAEFVQPVIDLLSKEFGGLEFEPEVSFAHHLGYGCKIDLVSRNREVTIDFKTKAFSKAEAGKKFAYSQQGMQLWANARAAGNERSTKLNLFISTEEPGLIVPYEWPQSSFYELKAFDLLLELWKIRKDYDTGWKP